MKRSHDILIFSTGVNIYQGKLHPQRRLSADENALQTNLLLSLQLSDLCITGKVE